MGKDLRGKIFVGFMFLGIGIGMVFNETGPGCLIGMGIGFIISSLIKDKDEKSDKSISSQLWRILLGLFFIFIGTSMLLNYEIMWKYIFPAFLILLGLSLILSALKK
jgi:NhaP-type Na+/H+ or K+/H+ antiporter